ncbi:Uncharacterised protein [[Clostridium] sordellii]|uniref:DUF3899 domain-containing protein n=1 Tax=Paraclostridium sordellii TaxID=1505 RepID=A0ABP1XVY0_PARSO|nr:DUF3899 domain-containing protein [Paeniclostridium sordellii]CEJ73762.1 hypothetical protein ATCC9714_16501 [[Clostridium] sordellii] [Paeniclostridium sordellii]CEN69310.1 Uncharacterised protein [[Clostridium] sordellii] [Paeniclostridium sordellii]CEN72578.1 Uncharacterised protein [[Clostridium] sordellii] [Paeniclostridium sordellii]CEO24181.1 Uncharacterised protein [[Clostridium] sordellii] [Paeniclostridium sordellii]CEP75829.1 Uncharacterised protein [[Clostridium] sordellii] [Pae
MFLLLGVLFLILGILLFISFKKKKASYERKMEKLTQRNFDKNNKKQRNKAEKAKEKSESELKKDKVNAYSFIAAGICCILVEITMKFL